MENISSSDLTFIGKGANGEVYKYNKPLEPSGLSAVVKISRMCMPRFALEKYEMIKHAGVQHLAFYEECNVDEKPALLMENLFTDDEVYVSPNSIKNGYENNLPESYLLQNKLNGITNMESLLMQMRDLAQCLNGKGIGLDMDMISFGVKKGDKDSPVSYKLVDIDTMLQDDGCRNKLYDSNVIAAKEVLTIFIKHFVNGDEVKKKLLQDVDSFNW